MTSLQRIAKAAGRTEREVQDAAARQANEFGKHDGVASRIAFVEWIERYAAPDDEFAALLAGWLGLGSNR